MKPEILELAKEAGFPHLHELHDKWPARITRFYYLAQAIALAEVADKSKLFHQLYGEEDLRQFSAEKREEARP